MRSVIKPLQVLKKNILLIARRKQHKSNLSFLTLFASIFVGLSSGLSLLLITKNPVYLSLIAAYPLLSTLLLRLYLCLPQHNTPSQSTLTERYQEAQAELETHLSRINNTGSKLQKKSNISEKPQQKLASLKKDIESLLKYSDRLIQAKAQPEGVEQWMILYAKIAHTISQIPELGIILTTHISPIPPMPPLIMISRAIPNNDDLKVERPCNSQTYAAIV